MSEINDLDQIIASLNPALIPGEYVFITRPTGAYGDGAELAPFAVVAEREGLTLVVEKQRADAAGESYQTTFRLITLQVHSSLEAVGLTASIATSLAQRNICVNIVAGFFHDHLFVQTARAEEAIEALSELSAANKRG